MRQSGRPDHERRRDEEHVERALASVGVHREPQLATQPVEPVKQVLSRAVGQLRSEADLRDDASGQQQGDEDRRHQVCEN